MEVFGGVEVVILSGAKDLLNASKIPRVARDDSFSVLTGPPVFYRPLPSSTVLYRPLPSFTAHSRPLPFPRIILLEHL